MTATLSRETIKVYDINEILCNALKCAMPPSIILSLNGMKMFLESTILSQRVTFNQAKISGGATSGGQNKTQHEYNESRGFMRSFGLSIPNLNVQIQSSIVSGRLNSAVNNLKDQFQGTSNTGNNNEAPNDFTS